jgi:hypothetical protein
MKLKVVEGNLREKEENNMRKIVGILAILLVCIFQYSFGIEETLIFKDAFIVRKVHGIIESEVGRWPGNYANGGIVFTLYGPDNSDKIWKIKLDNNGKFNQKVPQGRYKFTIEVCGWDDARGTIIVTKKAKKKAKIKIVLGLS